MITLQLTDEQEVAELSRTLRARRRALERVSNAMNDPVAAERLVIVGKILGRFDREVADAENR